MNISSSGQHSQDNLSFLVFSDDWDEHPSSCQHLFSHISKKHKVLWVNTIGMRNPTLTLSDFQKAISKIIKMSKKPCISSRTVHPIEGVIACQPFMLPFSENYLIRKLNAASVVHCVVSRLAQLNISNPVLVTTVPNACDYIGKCGESQVVYYCVDDFKEWPGLKHDLVKNMERSLIEQSNIFIATSTKLFDRLATYGKPTSLLTHGVDLELFRRTVLHEHSLLASIPKPRIGYFGLFDQRSDQTLLSDVASRMPDVSFVITGRVESYNLAQKNLPNVFFTGAVPYDDLPSIVIGLDALILPYVINDLTNSVSPLKLKEYLASGKPIVSTPIPEVTNIQSSICIARTADEWVESLHACLHGLSKVNMQLAADFWENETWECKAAQFLDAISLRTQIES